jgi:hypothetical protein
MEKEGNLVGDPNPGSGGHPGVVVLYDNVKLAVTNGIITVSVQAKDGLKQVRIRQATGEILS